MAALTKLGSSSSETVHPNGDELMRWIAPSSHSVRRRSSSGGDRQGIGTKGDDGGRSPETDRQVRPSDECRDVSGWLIAKDEMARLGILALLIVSLLGACSSPPAGATTSPSASIAASPSTAASPVPLPAGFPAQVAGMPVISVARADELLRAGKLDGEAVAVAGYFDQFSPPCPYPGRYIGPLEAWCRFVAFTDSRRSAQLCMPEASNGESCRLPSSTNLAPYLVSETSGSASSRPSATMSEPAALVVIGHAGDARQWQCTAAAQAQCASAFVVDRIAWAEGHDAPPAAPETGNQQTGKVIAPRMALAQVATAAGLGGDLLTGAAFRKGDIAAIDPRWNFAGDEIVWLVRSLGQASDSGSGEARPETVWLVDDATGRVVDSHPLKLAADYQPARLWQMVTAHGVACCLGDVLAFYRVESGDGAVVFEGMVPGGSSGETDSTTFGGSYGSGPLVLPAGRYSISAWLAPYSGGIAGAARGECSTQVSLRPLDDVALDADFPANMTCTFGPAPSPSPGS